jgi:hypothetical protein
VPACVTNAVIFGTKFSLFCNAEVNGAQLTRATIDIQNFHGTDTYTITKFEDGTVQFIDAAYVEFGVGEPSAGEPVTTCTIQAQGPASPQKGDVVSGTLHCDNLYGAHLYGDGGYQPGVWETVDGSFQVTIYM